MSLGIGLGSNGVGASGSGSGTVSVVGAGSLTSTAIVTGGGSATLQTPSATTTLDASGNISTPGSVTTGAGGAIGGYVAMGQGTATTAPTSSVGFQAPTSVTTKFMMTLPAAPVTGFLLSTGASDPSTVTFVPPTGSGNVVRDTSPTFAAGSNLKLTVPTADGTATGPMTDEFNCGYSSSAVGDLVYLDSSATWQKCDANTLLLYNGLLGIALEVKASAAALKVALPGSFVYATGFPTFTIGLPIYMSETAGAVTNTAPTTTDAASRIVGWGIHADKMYFFPSPDYVTHT